MTEKAAPKKRNPVRTRARILAAAYDLFAAQGYAKTGMREIAKHADVASSLVVRYFGTKEALFEEGLINAIYTQGFFVRDKAEFGKRMAQMVVQDEDARLPAAMVLAIADPKSKIIAQKVTRSIVLRSMEKFLGPPNAEARALNMLILLNGFVIQTRHLSLKPVPDETVEWLARALQNIVDEGDNQPAETSPD